MFTAALAATLSLAAMGGARADSLLTGAVNADGTRQNTGAPYTVSHPSTGRYILTFTNYTGIPYCLYNVIGANTHVTSEGISTKTCDVTFVNKKGSATNYLFVFFAAPRS
jgi:hypothetical protein